MDSKEEKKARKEAEKLAKEQARKEAEEAKKARKEEKKARKEAEEIAKEQARKEAEEAKKARKEEKKARKEAEEIDITSTGETVKRETVQKRQKLYKGEVYLLFQPPVDAKKLESLKNNLRRVKGLKILLTGGTADGGIQMVVSTVKPIPLLTHLRESPEVEKAKSKDATFYILLK